MKLIIAYFKPEVFTDVKQALLRAGPREPDKGF